MNSVISGEDFYDANGQFTGYSVDSVTGNGQDFYFQNGKTGHSVDSIIGNGQNYYGDDGSRGFSVDSPFGGGSDIFIHEDDNNQINYCCLLFINSVHQQEVIMSAEKKRLFTVDALKGLAILVVVTYHLIAPSPFRKVLNHFVEIVLILFFITSGYFYRPGKRTLGESIATRAKATMIPFLSYSLAFWAIGTVCLLIAKTETFMEAIWCLRNFFGGCIWNRVIQGWFGWEYHKLGSNYMFLADFWFLIALFLSSILFFLIADKVLDSWKKSAVCVVLLFAASGVMKALQVDLPYNIQLVPFWSAFILLGAMAGQHKLIENPPVTGAAGWITGVVLLAGGIAVSLLKEPSTNLFRGSFGENEPVQMLLIIAETVLAVSGLTLLFRLAENAGLRMKEFAWLGVHSLIIFLGHMFVAWIISGITGFSLKYKEPVEAGVVAGSVWVCLGSLTVTVLWALLLDRIKKAREAAKEKEKEAAGQ